MVQKGSTEIWTRIAGLKVQSANPSHHRTLSGDFAMAFELHFYIFKFFQLSMVTTDFLQIFPQCDRPKSQTISPTTQLPQLGHRRSWRWLNFAMRQAILTFSTAKFVQLPINLYKLYQTAPNQQGVVASLTSSVNSVSRVRIARIHRRSRRIAFCIAKSFCESRFKRDSQKLFCDATCDATAAKPGNPQIATIADPMQLPQQGHRRPSQKLSLAQLLRCDAMRQAIWRTILTFSTAKLYKGSRVAYKFVQVVSNRANIMVT